MSEAKRKFDKTIKRCSMLVKLYQKLVTDEKENTVNKDLLRASIVLAVAAIDSYITDVFSEYFIIYVQNYEISDEFMNFMSEIGCTSKKLFQLLKTENPYLVIKDLLDRHLERYTTQKFDVINKLFSYYGLNDIVSNAGALSKNETLLKTISAMISRRHQIVHDGDYKHRRINDINEAKTTEMIAETKLFIDCMEKIVSNKFKKYSNEGD